MIWITGDIHGNPARFSKACFLEQKEMTKDDTVIICGDFGLVWDYKGESKEEKYWLDWLEEKPFTTVFVDGNHECFNRIYQYPIKEWNGGKVHEIRPSVLHLMRGEVFEIEGKKIFAFGGASSHDISDGIIDGSDPNWKEKAKKMDKHKKYMYRIKGISWWQEELPSDEELKNGLNNLAKYGDKVDFIVTHCAPQSVAALISHGLYKPDYLTEYFSAIAEDVNFSKWFFGHYHDNRQILDKYIMLFEQIIRIN